MDICAARCGRIFFVAAVKKLLCVQCTFAESVTFKQVVESLLCLFQEFVFLHDIVCKFGVLHCFGVLQLSHGLLEHFVDEALLIAYDKACGLLEEHCCLVAFLVGVFGKGFAQHVAVVAQLGCETRYFCIGVCKKMFYGNEALLFAVGGGLFEYLFV